MTNKEKREKPVSVCRKFSKSHSSVPCGQSPKKRIRLVTCLCVHEITDVIPYDDVLYGGDRIISLSCCML